MLYGPYTNDFGGIRNAALALYCIRHINHLKTTTAVLGNLFKLCKKPSAAPILRVSDLVSDSVCRVPKSTKVWISFWIRLADGAVAISYSAMTSDGGAVSALSWAVQLVESIERTNVNAMADMVFIFISPFPNFCVG